MKSLKPWGLRRQHICLRGDTIHSIAPGGTDTAGPGTPLWKPLLSRKLQARGENIHVFQHILPGASPVTWHLVGFQ